MIITPLQIQVLLEIPNDGIDQDCDGSDLIVIVDNDGDGFDDIVDCDDGDASVYPGASEDTDKDGIPDYYRQ